MQYLLDTHTLLWFLAGSAELSSSATQSIEASDSTNYVSMASLWEIAIKVSIGKLELKTPYKQLSAKILENGFEILPISLNDTVTVSALPFHHRDPFDGIIVAQALNNSLSIISKHKHFSLYSTDIRW